jgi:hypothetical protein
MMKEMEISRYTFYKRSPGQAPRSNGIVIGREVGAFGYNLEKKTIEKESFSENP